MKIKELTKSHLILGLVLLTVLCLIMGFLVLYFLFPQYYFKLYPLVPIYFFLISLAEIRIIAGSQKKGLVFIMNKYMQLKAIKLFASLILLILYCFIVAEQTFVFLITFLLYYLIYLIVEAVVFYAKSK